MKSGALPKLGVFALDVCHRFQDRRPAFTGINDKVLHRGRLASAMPVLFTRRHDDYISLRHNMLGDLIGNDASSVGDNHALLERMNVPVGATSRTEADEMKLEIFSGRSFSKSLAFDLSADRGRRQEYEFNIPSSMDLHSYPSPGTSCQENSRRIGEGKR